MKWFGKHWGAIVCSNPQVSTPVGATCYLCNDKPIQEGDRGIYFDDAVFGTPEKPELRVLVAHLRCFLLSIAGDNKAGIDKHLSKLP